MASICEAISMIDPSELHRPENDCNNFRRYSNNVSCQQDSTSSIIKVRYVISTLQDQDPIQQRVRQTYRQMHLNQTFEFVRAKLESWCKFDKIQLSIRPALEMLNNLVDESDPDVDLPNIVHAFQTAEQLRADYPQLDWLHLTGLIHDLGSFCYCKTN